MFFLLLLVRFWQVSDVGDDQGSAVRAASLVRAALTVADEAVVENSLHLFDGLEPGAAALDAEVLVV